MDAWEILVSRSLLESSTHTAWEHLKCMTGMCVDSRINVEISDDEYSIKLSDDDYFLSIDDEILSVALEDDSYSALLDTDSINVNIDLDSIIVSVSCGASLTPEDELLQKTAGENVGGLRVVTTDSNGDVVHATIARILAGKSAIGVNVDAASTGELCDIGITGDELSEPSWNWDEFKEIYLDGDGLLTQTVPTENFLMVIGVPLSPTSMRIRIEPPIFLL